MNCAIQVTKATSLTFDITEGMWQNQLGMKGRDHQHDSVAASTANHQNAPSEKGNTNHTARDANVTRDIKYDIKTLNIKDFI